LLEVIAQAVPDLELRADMVPTLHTPVPGKPDAHAPRHDPLLVTEADEGISPGDPVSFCVLEVSETLGIGCILHDPQERALSSVVVLGVVHVDDTLPFHVGLASKEEDLEGVGLGFGIRSENGRQRQEK